jgi:hypothetical protein
VNGANIICACVAATNDVEHIREADGRIPLEEFGDLRDKCLALLEILIPDETWPQFREWHTLPDDAASHSSVILLAFRRGYLPRLTGPVHRYLMSPAGILPSVSKQYVKDLRERWMFDADPVERNRLSRIFRGRLIELQFASWLESQSHRIVGMEATRKGPDIETLSESGEANAFEVKFFGMEDGDFRVLLRSMGGYPAGGAVSPYQAINYLLFRVYEAARQLRATSGRKTAVVVIDELSWFRFDMQLRGNWIDWENPRFIAPDDHWNQFLSLQQRRYPDLPNDLVHMIRGIDSVKIFRQNAAFEFRLEKEFSQK